MTQNHTLYEILNTDENGFLLRMLEGHPVYEGHFPGNPITPGVLSIQMVRECLSCYFGRNLQFTTIKNCRLVAMIRPGDKLRLSFLTEFLDDTFKVKATLSGADNPEDLRLQIDAELR